MLRQARVPFEVVPAAVDEAAVKAAMLAEGAPARDIADALAELKARRGRARAPERLVLGADQVLACDGRLFDKPRDLAEARAQLAALRGRSATSSCPPRSSSRTRARCGATSAGHG